MGKSNALVGSRMLHDPKVYSKIKLELSDAHFNNTKVSTCSHIKRGNDGRAIAIPYPLEKTGWKHPMSHQNLNRSSQVESLMRTTFSNKGFDHAGMVRKPLEPYNPNAKRSRLPIASIVMPYKNSS